MFEFVHPYAFLALPLPLLVRWLLPPHRIRVSALRVPFFESVARAAGAEPDSGAVIVRRGLLQVAGAALVWAAIITGLARPEWVGEPITRTEAARDIMLAVDLSGSMDYRDFPGLDDQPVSRFAAVQRVVAQFVGERQEDRVGLIVFGDRAYLQLPFTRDLATAAALVDLMEVGMAGPRTALGDAVGLAIRSFESSQVSDRVLILLTDGNDTASRMTPINAAGIAAQNGIQIHTIGIGDESARGEDRVDFGVLRNVAERTGGTFSNAQDEQTLGRVYSAIDAATAARTRTESWRPRTALLVWPAGAAVILMLLGYPALLIRHRRRAAA